MKVHGHAHAASQQQEHQRAKDALMEALRSRSIEIIEKWCGTIATKGRQANQGMEFHSHKIEILFYNFNV